MNGIRGAGGEEVVKVIARKQLLNLEDLGLAELVVRIRRKPQAVVKPQTASLKPRQTYRDQTECGLFGPRGMIEVPDDSRSIVVKKVEEIPTGKAARWSEDSIVIRTHK